MTYGKRLRAMRNLRRLTQKELADLSGKDDGNISKLERDAIKTTTSYTLPLANALRANPYWLQEGDGQIEQIGIVSASSRAGKKLVYEDGIIKIVDDLSSNTYPISTVVELPVLCYDDVIKFLTLNKTPRGVTMLMSPALILGTGFFLVMEDKAMEPRKNKGYPLGWHVLFDTKRTVTKESKVLVDLNGDGRVLLFRQLIDGVLVPMNKSFPDVNMNDNSKVLAVAVGSAMKVDAP